MLTIARLSVAELEANTEALADILHACVNAGAGVGFVQPFPLQAARGFWRDSVQPAAARGVRIVLAARLDETLAGTVQLGIDTMPNQVHRADVMKLLVHPTYRRRGIGRALMSEVERIALGLQRTLLTLDTVTGDKAEPLYLSLGYTLVGCIPNYARSAHGRGFDATSIMYKTLAA
ncbi:N-acetyltransferase [Afipia sp. P52-10]|uniref:GNAT family N-acetyltransferase n=1 Tax=Afipia sp. P52-10 TaxID=1429916 RepID=UPI0004B36A1F|nr:GNAT family N-acetyltransferase [Afipia sp. P52-10]